MIRMNEIPRWEWLGKVEDAVCCGHAWCSSLAAFWEIGVYWIMDYGFWSSGNGCWKGEYMKLSLLLLIVGIVI